MTAKSGNDFHFFLTIYQIFYYYSSEYRKFPIKFLHNPVESKNICGIMAFMLH